ncbi:hypothetical protein POK33_39695 [Burkholderia cenocepacia]|uniref:hypothetical protein n=1 Tax=Burkholderia cenocepacia TaxID=95486 RepID=UPI0023B8B06E|nr:hypothetical protein [Burkholderia cenocepacia]MDF0506878.1 hypothetical protein [Burkholderia cenocepacia]
MGATIITGKCAGAFVSNEGKLLYVLFAQSYEKNVYPHTPKWSAFAFGTREEVLKRAFVGAADCCGGMLQSRAGEIKPENYIEAWKQELNRPMRMRNVVVDLKFGDSWRARLPVSAKDRVFAALDRVGLASRIEHIEAGTLHASLYEDTTLLLSIYGVDGVVMPWCAFDHGDVGSVRQEVPVTRNAPVSATSLPTVRCYAVDKNIRLVAGEDGDWHDGEWSYSVLSGFVRGIVLDGELRHPGYAKAAIPHVRTALDAAPPLPLDTKITVWRTACKHDYQRSAVDELARSLGLASEGAPAPDAFSFAFSDIQGEDADRIRYRVGSMQGILTWSVPDAAHADANDKAVVEQGELLFG